MAVSEFDDKWIVCKDCGIEFVWPAKDQDFYASQGFTPPKRCKDCREKKKRERGRG